MQVSSKPEPSAESVLLSALESFHRTFREWRTALTTDLDDLDIVSVLEGE